MEGPRLERALTSVPPLPPAAMEGAAAVLDGAPVAVPGIAGLRALDAARAIDGARVYGS